MTKQASRVKIYISNDPMTGLPAGVQGTEEGTKYLLRQKGVQLSNCVPTVMGYEYSNPYTIASNGIDTECVVGNISRNGKQKLIADLCKVVDGVFKPVQRVDFSVLDLDSNNYNTPSVQWCPITEKFLCAVHGGASKLAIIDPVSGAVTYTSNLNGVTASSGMVGVKSGVGYLPFFFESNGSTVWMINTTTMAASSFSAPSTPVPGSSTAFFQARMQYTVPAGNGKHLAVISDDYGYGVFRWCAALLDPTTGFGTPFVVDFRPAFPGKTVNICGGSMFRPHYLSAHDVFLGYCITDNKDLHAVVFNNVGAILTTIQLQGTNANWPGSIYLNTVAGTDKGAITFAVGDSSYPDGVKAVFSIVQYDGESLSLAVSKTVSPKSLVGGWWRGTTGYGRWNTYNAGGNYAAGRYTQYLEYLYGHTPLSGSNAGEIVGDLDQKIAAEQRLVQDFGSAMVAAYPALWIPPEESDLDAKPITVLTSNFEGEISGLPSKNYLISLANEVVEDNPGNGKREGLARVTSMINVTSMNTSCVLQGPGRIIVIETME